MAEGKTDFVEFTFQTNIKNPQQVVHYSIPLNGEETTLDHVIREQVLKKHPKYDQQNAEYMVRVDNLTQVLDPEKTKLASYAGKSLWVIPTSKGKVRDQAY